MLLFVISFTLVFVSSYFLSAILTKKSIGFCYTFLIAFAQVILSFEFLSLINGIRQWSVLALNSLFFFITTFLWIKKGRPSFNLNFCEWKNKVLNSFKLDKSLFVLYICYCIFIISAIFLCFISPITNDDAQAYHVARSLMWVLQGNLNHFVVSDIRNLCMPINSEILYSWVILFIKKDVLLGFFSFTGYILSIYSVYKILGLIGCCTRKKLWVIFILSSFASVIVQASGTETDIIIASLILMSVYMFWEGLKNSEKTPIFMASLSYAIAVGVKTPAILIIPSVVLLMLFLCKKYENFKYFRTFTIFFVLNFIIFSAYNYILNFIHFSNPLGPDSFVVVSKNYYGIQGMLSNFIKYIFMFIDFTGMKITQILAPYIIHLRSEVLTFFHLEYVLDGLYTKPYTLNRTLVEPLMGTGILGILVFVPALIYSFLAPALFLFRKKNINIIGIFGLTFLVNILVMSYFLAYMSFSVRFMVPLIILASPVLIYSYFSNKNPLKYIIILYSIIYLTIISTSLSARPFFIISRILFKNPSITFIRNVATCTDYEKIHEYVKPECFLTRTITNDFAPKTRVLVFLDATGFLYLVKSLEFKEYYVDIANLKDYKKIDFNKYNLVVMPSYNQHSTYIDDYTPDKLRQINLKNDKLVSCEYSYNDKIPNKTNHTPYKIECSLTEKFIVKHNLKIIGLVGMFYETKSADYFNIYNNLNNPAKSKVKEIIKD